MPIKPPKPPPKTISFMRFRSKHIELSQIYWRHVVGAEAVSNALTGAADKSFAVDVLGVGTTKGQFGFNVRETNSSVEEHLNRTRLHLLAICCANLEAFLHDVAFGHIATLGFKQKPGELSASGKALGSPILGKSSLPEPLKYAQHLFGVDYGVHSSRLNRAYKYRCALVHNGGVVTPRTIAELSLSGAQLHSRLGYSWANLKEALESAFEVASITDRKLSTYQFRFEEFERELCFLRDAKTLAGMNVWKYFHDEGFFPLPRKIDREKMLKAVGQ